MRRLEKMLDPNLVHSVISHENRKYLLNDLLNGTNRWFYDALSQVNPTLDAEATKQMLRMSLKNYLGTLYRVFRNAGVTSQVYSKFYHENDKSLNAAMIYLLKTLKTMCGELYIAAIIALWVDLERREGDYKEYVRKCTGDDDAGIEVEPFLLYNFVCSAFVAAKKAEGKVALAA